MVTTIDNVRLTISSWYMSYVPKSIKENCLKTGRSFKDSILIFNLTYSFICKSKT